MLEIIGAGASGKSTQDWHAVWRESPEAKNVQTELEEIQARGSQNTGEASASSNESNEFAMPFGDQLWHVVIRVFQQYWRDPQYIFAKLILGILASLFIGFTFYRPDSSQQGMEDTLFSTFMMTSIFSTLVQQ